MIFVSKQAVLKFKTFSKQAAIISCAFPEE